MTVARDEAISPHTVSGHGYRVAPATTPVSRQATVGGWLVSCVCGEWEEQAPSRKDAQYAYARHLGAARRAAWFRCRMCQTRKPPADRSRARGSGSICKKCVTAKVKAWARDNPESYERARRNSYLRKTYGITVEEYEAMLAAQGNLCAACRREPADPRGYRAHVDHDHATGAVRGILCFNCNMALGAVRDRIDVLESLIRYLREHSA